MSGADPQAMAAEAGSSSFALGMRILPRAERAAIHAIYHFCRVVDDIADDQVLPRDRRAGALAEWREAVAALYRGEPVGMAEFLRGPVQHFALAEADFVAVIDGMAMDVAGDIRWPDYATLDLYCDRVASAVGRLCVRVFGMAEAPGLALSHHLGRALQLANILRDIDEDAAIGRVYLPAEALAAAGIVPTTPAALVADPRLDAAARWLVVKARAHFAEARAIMAARPAGRLLAPHLMAAGYGDVLDRLEARGWASPRAPVRTRKAAILGAALAYMVRR